MVALASFASLRETGSVSAFSTYIFSPSINNTLKRLPSTRPVGGRRTGVRLDSANGRHGDLTGPPDAQAELGFPLHSRI